MRLDRANRTFAALVGASAVAGLVVGLGAALLAALLAGSAARGVGSLPPIDVRFAVVFLAPVATGAVAGLVCIRRQVRATRQLRRRVRTLRVPPPPQVVQAAARARLRRRVDVVAAPEPFSLAYGMLRPRVVVSTGLAEALEAEEIEAVLHHERYHVSNLDPLKVVAARTLTALLYYFPALGHLRRRYVAGRELAADRRAMVACGRRTLASALYKVASAPAWGELGAAAAIGGPELIDMRVTQLETGREPGLPPPSRLIRAGTALAAALLAGSFVASVRPLRQGVAAIGSALLLSPSNPEGWGLARGALGAYVGYRLIRRSARRRHSRARAWRLDRGRHQRRTA